MLNCSVLENVDNSKKLSAHTQFRRILLKKYKTKQLVRFNVVWFCNFSILVDFCEMNYPLERPRLLRSRIRKINVGHNHLTASKYFPRMLICSSGRNGVSVLRNLFQIVLAIRLEYHYNSKMYRFILPRP